jgi:hypothetical protein
MRRFSTIHVVDISMWGGNTTSIDILVKPDSLDKVKERLTDNGIEFEVVIDDLQRAIDEENPTDIELDDRRGRLFIYLFYLSTLFKFHLSEYTG